MMLKPATATALTLYASPCLPQSKSKRKMGEEHDTQAKSAFDHARKDEIVASMAARDAERQEKKRERLADANPDEDVHKFFQDFTDKLEGLRRNLEDIEAAAASGTEVAELTEKFAALRDQAQAVQEFANAGSLYLPPYDQRSMQMKMSKFDEDRAAAQARLVPRKKFGFKRKDKKKPAATNMAAAEAGSRHSDAVTEFKEHAVKATASMAGSRAPSAR